MSRPNLHNDLFPGQSASAICIDAGLVFFAGAIVGEAGITTLRGDASGDMFALRSRLNEQRYREGLPLAKGEKPPQKNKPVTKRVTDKSNNDSSQSELF